MPDQKTFVGNFGTYTLPESTSLPQATGRASLIFRATDDAGAFVCVKLYLSHPGPQKKLSRNQGTRLAHNAFDTELEAYCQLEHPNILRLIDYGADGERGTLFLVLPWCDGGDLRQIMGQRQFFPLNETVAVLSQVALAIDYAHTLGFVHGDVKAENILFGSRHGSPYLSDFGSTRRAAYRPEITKSGSGGTTAYLAPEQISFHRTTSRSDIYAFGIVAYEMLTSRTPVDRYATEYAQMQAKVEGKLLQASKANPSLPIHVADAVMFALETDPSKRPATATELCKMLSGEIPAKRPIQVTRSRRLLRKHRVAIITAAIAAIGSIAVALVNALSTRGKPGDGTRSPSASGKQTSPSVPK